MSMPCRYSAAAYVTKRDDADVADATLPMIAAAPLPMLHAPLMPFRAMRDFFDAAAHDFAPMRVAATRARAMPARTLYDATP